jgi:hypothetical protein
VQKKKKKKRVVNIHKRELEKKVLLGYTRYGSVQTVGLFGTPNHDHSDRTVPRWWVLKFGLRETLLFPPPFPPPPRGRV